MIERAYPGVYLATLASEAKPIDGVPTTPPGADAPAWTESDARDPGVTFAELFGFLSESLLYRVDPMPYGTAQGLSPAQTPSEQSPLRVSPGLALDPTGRSITSDVPAVTSKYIGETEKHVGAEVRDAAPSRALLHYDDAQGLFGKCD